MCSLITCVSKIYNTGKTKREYIILMQLKKEEDLDKIAGLIEKKRDMITGKHKKGDVVTANIPANKIEEIARDYSVESILPNRVYRAYRIASHK